MVLWIARLAACLLHSLLALLRGNVSPLLLLRRARAHGNAKGRSMLLHELGDLRLVPADSGNITRTVLSLEHESSKWAQYTECSYVWAHAHERLRGAEREREPQQDQRACTPQPPTKTRRMSASVVKLGGQHAEKNTEG